MGHVTSPFARVFSGLAIASASFIAIPAMAAATSDTIMDSGFEPGEMAPMTGPCSNFYQPGFTLLQGMLNPPTLKTAKPAKGVVMTDPGFDTCMVRATQHDVEPPKTFARNDYSRREPFNADNSRILVYSQGGWWHLYDAATLKYVKQLVGPAGDAEPQWDATNPSKLYYIPKTGGMKLYTLDVNTNVTTTVADFTGKLPWPDVNGLWTKSEGSPSKDMRYWGFQAESNFNIRGYVVYDLVQNRVIGTHATTVRPDHVSMTPSGRWFESSDDINGTWAWSPDFSQKKKLHHKSEHSDIAIGANGHDYYVSIDYQTNGGDVFYVDIDACPAVPASADPASTPLCPRTVLFHTYMNGTSTSIHISGKAYAKPGWIVMSTFGTKPDRSVPPVYPWFTNKIFAIELNPTPRVYGLGYHQDNPDGYWTEVHGAANRDLSRVMFNSNWNILSSTDVDDYMIQIGPRMIPAARP